MLLINKYFKNCSWRAVRTYCCRATWKIATQGLAWQNPIEFYHWISVGLYCRKKAFSGEPWALYLGPLTPELLRHSVYFSGISNQRPRVQNASMTATLYHTKQHLWTQFVFFDIENDIALCFLLSLQLYVLSVIWHAFILKASLRCWQEVVVAMETRKVSQRAELVIKSVR